MTEAGPADEARQDAATGRQRRVAVFLAAVLLAGAALQQVVNSTPVTAGSVDVGVPPSVLLVAFLVAFAVTEIVVVYIPRGRNSYTVTVSDLPLVAGLFLLGPAYLVLARVLGGTLPLVVRNRRSPLKLVFNVGWFWIEVCTALLVWHLIVGEEAGLQPLTWLAAGAVTVIGDFLGTMLLTVAMSLHSGTVPTLRELVAEAKPLVVLVNASGALVIVYVVSLDWRALWTVAVVVGVLVFAQRAHNRLRFRTESLEQVGRFTGEIGGQVDVDSAARAALSWMTEALNADVAELILTEEFAGVQRRWVARHDGDLVEVPGPGFGHALAPWLATEPLLVRNGEKDMALVGALQASGLGDAVAMPLHGDGQIMGTLVVGDRLGDVATFQPSDLRQLVALGNHLGVTLRNARRADLIREHADDQLRRSLHDELTGLPNRRCLEQRLAAHLDSGRRATVLLLDLDRFKDINDTLGHAAGDMLLVMVAERLARTAPGDALVARLGGDEYAVLLSGEDDAATSAVVALIRHAFTAPFGLQDLQVTVEASLGVAPGAAPDQASDLLRRADIAMFAAKTRRTGVETYRDSLDAGTPARLTLLTDLRAAITTGSLTVHFQPQVRLRDGVVLGAEALVRWEHPQRGTIFPDEFIPVAEHSGLITPLTFTVLRQALAACATWRRTHGDMTVAVNMSPRSLLEPSFTDEVARAIAAVEVPASAVTLEITESSLMADPERAIEALTRLTSLGVRLSIDDLGTGYSSLSYLQRLPVSEVKVDRSFLMPGTADTGAFAIVGAIVDLGHRLARDVVAEGVEDEDTWRRLQRLGCDSAQGYWLSPPQSAADFAQWLAAWRPRAVAPLRAIG